MKQKNCVNNYGLSTLNKLMDYTALQNSMKLWGTKRKLGVITIRLQILHYWMVGLIDEPLTGSGRRLLNLPGDIFWSDSLFLLLFPENHRWEDLVIESGVLLFIGADNII